MRESFLHFSSRVVVPSFFSRPRSAGLGLGFHETTMAALSGSTQHSSFQQKLQHRKTDEDEEAEAADEKKKKDAPDAGLLKKQLGEPPEKPLPGDCCGSGCVRCVWDIYFEELELYNSHKAALEADCPTQ